MLEPNGGDDATAGLVAVGTDKEGLDGRGGGNAAELAGDDDARIVPNEGDKGGKTAAP